MLVPPTCCLCRRPAATAAELPPLLPNIGQGSAAAFRPDPELHTTLERNRRRARGGPFRFDRMAVLVVRPFSEEASIKSTREVCSTSPFVGARANVKRTRANLLD